MIAAKVLTEKDVHNKLSEKGFQKTAESIETGCFWANKDGKHILVPHSDNGFYPNWMLEDLQVHIGQISIWGFSEE